MQSSESLSKVYDLPFFDNVHRQLVRDLSWWCGANLARDEREYEDVDIDAHCRALVTALGEAGWLRYCVPANVGGVFPQLDVRMLCLIRETLAYHEGLADFAFAMQGLGSGAITLAGTSEQQQHYLPGVAAGKLIAAFALSEPDAGSDAAALTTTATRDDNSFCFNGSKTWI